MVMERSCSMSRPGRMISGVRSVIASSSGRVNATSLGRAVPVIAGIAVVRTVDAFSAAFENASGSHGIHGSGHPARPRSH